MLLAEQLPQSDVTRVADATMAKKLSMENLELDGQDDKKEEEEEEEKKMKEEINSYSYAPIKLSLPSSQPILAVSNTHILVNEYTRRKQQFVVYDGKLEKFTVPSPIKGELLDALWYEADACFLILTQENIYKLVLKTKQLALVNDINPTKKKSFKTFALLNSLTLLIAYDEWGRKEIEYWQQDCSSNWKLMETKILNSSSHEFVGKMITIERNNLMTLVMTIYNELTQQWRMEIRDAETFKRCQRRLELPGSNSAQDYMLTPIENSKDDIQWLSFLSGSANITSIDSNNQQKTIKYRSPIQKMAVFDGNYLIVRTKAKIDIHFFE